MDLKEFDKILKDLVINTDEFEGLNALDLNKIDLCAPDNNYDFSMPNPYLPHDVLSILDIINKVNDDMNRLNTDTNNFNTNDIIKNLNEYVHNLIDDITNGTNNSLNYVDNSNNEIFNIKSDDLKNEAFIIIEFGDEYTLGEKLDYTLHVKPGLKIDKNTIIATIHLNGEEKQVRSIFETGEILKDEKTGDFLHIYPSYATRHIIITNTTVGTGIDYDIEDIKVYIEKMKTNALMFSFIKDNMCYSILPSILLHREKESKHFIKGPAGSRVAHDTLGLCPCTQSHKLYNKYIKHYEDLLNDWLSSFKDIVSKERIYATRTSSTKMDAMYREVLAKREELLKWIVSYYDKRHTLGDCRWVKNADDCRYLAWGAIRKKIKHTDAFETKIGEVWYNSYYGILLSKLMLASHEQWNQKYYDILKGIMDKRIQLEHYSKASLINEFDNLYLANIQNIQGGFEIIRKDFITDINNTDDDSALYSKVYQYLTNKITNKENSFVCQLLSNIFWFILHYNEDETKETNNQELKEEDILKLVDEERIKLETFWSEAILEYYKNSMDIIALEFENYAKSLNKYAEWPNPMTIPIEGTMYTLYEFNNFPVETHEETEEDIPDLLHLLKPSQEPKLPTGPATPSIPEDISHEITVKDTAYWRKYFSLATVISLPFLADGFDIPPHMSPTPLPAIYICFSAIYIPLINMVLVIGMGIRGIWFFPILQVVNLNSVAANGLLPLIIAAKNLKALFNTKLQSVEENVGNMAALIISKLENENSLYNRDILKYTLYLDTLRNLKIENEHLIEDALHGKFLPTADLRLVIIRADKLVGIPETKKFKHMYWTEEEKERKIKGITKEQQKQLRDAKKVLLK